MVRSALRSRATLLAAVNALAALSVGVGASNAQAPRTTSALQSGYVDPVSAAVAEASRRFGVPEPWIWSVMRVESAGRSRAVSHAGAMGLMQVMPGTYAELRSRYGLGSDPFDVRDNVLAGTAYLREMHDRYGVQGMLAAYNAGPARWEAYVRAGRRLPAETVGYLARLAPEVGAASVPVVSPVQPVSVAQAPRPTLFVQIGGAPVAAETQGERSGFQPSAAAAPVPVATPEGVFVPRSAASGASATSTSDTADQPTVGRAVLPANPLFVPVRTLSDHP